MTLILKRRKSFSLAYEYELMPDSSKIHQTVICIDTDRYRVHVSMKAKAIQQMSRVWSLVGID